MDKKLSDGNLSRKARKSSKDTNLITAVEATPVPFPHPMRVHFEGTTVSLDEAPQSFGDFDDWCRVRFGLEARDVLKFVNFHTGNELIPHASLNKAGTEIEVVLLQRTPMSPQKVPPTTMEALPKPAVSEPIPNEVLIKYGATMLIILVAISLTPNMGKTFDLLLTFAGVSDLQASRALVVDAYIAFLSWSTSYLFIRRMWNPENYGVVYQKFAADAFFGGLAASATCLMKPILTHMLE